MLLAVAEKLLHSLSVQLKVFEVMLGCPHVALAQHAVPGDGVPVEVAHFRAPLDSPDEGVPQR